MSTPMRTWSPRGMATRPGLEPEYVVELGRHQVVSLVRVCERAPEEFVYHLVLRNDPGDRRLSDEEGGQVCRAAMDRTGIAPEGDPAGSRWVPVRHAEDHVHLHPDRSSHHIAAQPEKLAALP